MPGSPHPPQPVCCWVCSVLLALVHRTALCPGMAAFLPKQASLSDTQSWISNSSLIGGWKPRLYCWSSVSDSNEMLSSLGVEGLKDPPPAAAQHPGLPRRVLHDPHMGSCGPLHLPGQQRSGELRLLRIACVFISMCCFEHCSHVFILDNL